MLNSLLLKIWNSPTLMTWASLASRSLSLVLVLPLIISHFEAADIALWYLFGSALILQNLTYAGFGSTFIRVIAFAYGGASVDQLKYDGEVRDKSHYKIKTEHNWKGIERVLSTMNYIYKYIGILIFIVIGLSSLLLVQPIGKSSSETYSWISWIIIATGSVISLRGSIFSVYLEGTNHVALLRRWDAIFGIIGIISNIIVLLIFSNLISLVISSQFWLLASIPRNYYLSRKIDNGEFKAFSLKGRYDETIFSAIWDSSWKSILGTFMSVGLYQLSNLLIAQIESSELLASYLIAFTLIKQISTFSKAPFYSKIPLLARLRKQDNEEKLIHLAQRGMLLTYWLFFIASFIVGLTGTYLLDLINGNAAFPPILLWGLLVYGALLERFGALHIQLYSTTNHIVWHISNGVTGSIYLIVALSLMKSIGVYSFPIAIIVSNAAFYIWYCSRLSYQSLKTNFWQFDRKIFLPVILVSSIIMGILIIDKL